MNKTREEIIYELLLSINKSGGVFALNVDYAINQYDKLVEKGIIKEVEKNENSSK